LGQSAGAYDASAFGRVGADEAAEPEDAELGLVSDVMEPIAGDEEATELLAGVDDIVEPPELHAASTNADIRITAVETENPIGGVRRAGPAELMAPPEQTSCASQRQGP